MAPIAQVNNITGGYEDILQREMQKPVLNNR